MRCLELLNVTDIFLIGHVELGVFLGDLGIDALLKFAGCEEKLAVAREVPLTLILTHLLDQKEEGESGALLIGEILIIFKPGLASFELLIYFQLYVGGVTRVATVTCLVIHVLVVAQVDDEIEEGCTAHGALRYEGLLNTMRAIISLKRSAMRSP